MNPVDIYNQAVARVPAYRAFLQQKTGAIPTVATLDEFNRNVPFMTKTDYVMAYDVPDLCLDGRPECAHLWLRSSGTSKKPFFWPRRPDDEKAFPTGMRALFHRYLTPEAQPTLIVVGLALGPWGTGMQCSYAFRVLALEHPGLAVVSPGLQNDSIIEVLERISPLYRRTLLLSYPPFAKMVIEEAHRRGIDLHALNLHVMVGGEGITETYRERMCDLLGHRPTDLDAVWSLYGSTDFANVGFENPLTIAIRRYLVKTDRCRQVLGEPDVPMLFQRIPNTTYFEVVDGELVVSRIQGIPLVRYRSGDHMRIIPRDELLQRLRDEGFDAEQAVRDTGLTVPETTTPFIALYGRIDQAVYFYGAKISVEQVKTALEAPTLAAWYNGRFLLRGFENQAGNPMIEVALEESDALRQAGPDAVADQFAVELAKIQSEFREVCKLTPGQRHVRITPAPAKTFELGWKTRRM